MRNNIQKISLQLLLRNIYIIFSIIISVYILNIKTYDKLGTIIYIFIFLYALYSSILIFFLKEYIFIDFNFIFMSIFTIYSIIGPLYYVIFNAQYVTYEVYSGIDVVQKTLIQYFMFFIVYSALTFLKPIRKKLIDIKVDRISKFSFLVDGIATIILLYWMFLIITRVGVNIFSLSKDASLTLIGSSKLINYGNYFMVSYTIYYLIYYINKYFSCNKKKVFINIRVFLILFYYSTNIIIGNRRTLLMILLMLFVFVSNYLIKTNQQNKFKYLFIAIGIIIFLLLLKGISREKATVANSEYKYIKFFGEFVYNQWVSYYYVGNINLNTNLYYGLTFFIYPIIFLFPSFLIPNKPEELALIFWREAGTNQALAFNPISEGILNFGNASFILTPIIYFLYLNFFNYKKYTPYLYIVLIGSAMDICRGQFAIVFFEVLFIYISFKLIKFINYNLC